MVIKRGAFRHDALYDPKSCTAKDMVIYEIDEDVVDGSLKIKFTELDAIWYYSKRKQSYKIEVRQRIKTVIPIKIRPIEETIKLIKEYYKTSTNSTFENKEFIRCDIVKNNGRYELETTDYGREKVMDFINTAGIEEQDFLRCIDNYKSSGYR